MTRRVGLRPFAAAGALLAIVLAGCSHQSTTTPSVSPVTPTTPPALSTTEKSTGEVTIYQRSASAATSPADDPMGGLVAVTRNIPVDAMSPARDALQYLVSTKDTPMPRGTKLLAVSVDNASATATVNFSRQFADASGETEAQMAVNSVLATMGQFSNVNYVQMQVEGKSDVDMGGAVSLTDPMPVIRPGSTALAEKEDKP